MEEDRFGFKEATKLLQGLRPSERQRLLGDIEKKDSVLANALKQNLYQFDDLKYMSPKMLIELLREVSLDKLGIALKNGSTELKSYILNNVSSNMKKEILDNLEGKLVPVSQVESSISEIMEIVLRKVERGELVLDQGLNDTII